MKQIHNYEFVPWKKMEAETFQVLAEVKTWNSHNNMIFLYYAEGGTRSPHPHIVFNKANGLVAAAPLSSIWPGPLPLVDIPNWDDEVYLTRGGADASLGSRFTESEPYAQCVVFLLMLWPRSSPSHPTAPPRCTHIPVASWTSFSPSSSHHPSIRPTQIRRIRVVLDSHGARPFCHTSVHPTLLSMYYSYIGF